MSRPKAPPAPPPPPPDPMFQDILAQREREFKARTATVEAGISGRRSTVYAGDDLMLETQQKKGQARLARRNASAALGL